MTSSLCLSVLVGCPVSPTQLPEGPCLIIDAESIDKKELIAQESFYAHYRELSADDVVLLNQTVISEFDHQIVEWHNFSDRRFNGPSQLSEFSEQYPNLRLIESRKIEGITLSTVLVDQKILSDSLSTFQLILREGDPLVALQSAKEWLARCTRISLRGLVTSSKSREAAEAFLGASGFCKSSVDSCVWTPELEVSSLHLSLIRCGLLALFNADVYRKLYPQTKEMTDVELINHWLSQPDFREIAKEIDKNTHNSLDRDGILALFNADVYRKLYPQTKEMTDVELIDHWLSQPDFREIAKEIDKNTHNSLDRDGILALFNADVYRKLYPQTKEMTDVELIDHWLSQPDFREIAKEIDKNTHNSLDRDGILALFNADVYRKLYPQTKEMTDVELIDHWLSQPDFRDVSKLMNDAIQRNPTPLAELTDQDPVLQLLHNIFPFDFYRSQRSDLSQISNRELIHHYWTNGQYEGIDLSESNVKNVLDKDQSLQVNRLTTRIHELEHLLSCANAQISAMQKLIVSSRDSGAANEQD
ncbi:hypothetical protein [Synechococcus sp. A15-24]|uniref:hypothetical protein n=1 Tax=Synechococcus sp. A15-24 TaxID=1050635 RepID=UPI0016478A0E|nr:hypothetical protein [Synechococcus sp. A15-24]